MIAECCKPSSCTETLTRVTSGGLQKINGGESNGSRIRFLDDDDLALRLIGITHSEDTLVGSACPVNVRKLRKINLDNGVLRRQRKHRSRTRN